MPYLARTAYYAKTDSWGSSQDFQDLSVIDYKLDRSFMLDRVQSSDNEKFYIVVENTQPLNSVYNAPVVATKGHYYGVRRSDLKKFAQIYDPNHSMIYGTEEDDSYLTVEKYTGMTLKSQQCF